MWVRQLLCVVVRVRLRRPHRKRGGRSNHLQVSGGLRGMGDSPPEGFEDFVVERGPALHRTAVLLTRQEQAAVNLVQVALSKAWRTWSRIDGNPEAYVRAIMVNEFASGWRRRWHGQQPTAELPELPGDDLGGELTLRQSLMAALATLPARQQAVVVLRFFHDYPEAAIAEAMGTRIGTVRSRTFDALAALRVTEELREVAVPDLAAPVRVGDVPSERTLDDLRNALHDEADAAAYQDVEALVAGARRRVAASRRRRLAVLGATTAAILVFGGVIATTRPTHQVVPPATGLGPFTVSAGGDGFPEYQQGMKRLIVVEAPMLERAKGSISVPTTPGRRLAVRMTCTPSDNTDKMNEWDARMLAKFTTSGGTGQAGCGWAIGGYDSIGVATDAKTAVQADVFISHSPSPSLPSLFKDAKIQVAIYESVPWQEYPFPPRPADLETSAQYAWSNEPGTVRVLGPKTAQEANKPVTFTQPFDPKLMVNLQIRGPGRIRVLINGKDVNRQVGASYPPDKFISSWGYDKGGLAFPLDPLGWAALRTGATGPTTKPGTPVTVTIEPRTFGAQIGGSRWS